VVRDAHIKRPLAAGIAIGVAAFPAAAQADFFAAAGSGAHPSAVICPPAQHRGPSTQTAFDWADAGIAAGGAIVLAGAGAASAVAMGRRRVVGVA
jgi:hypothetical protein